MRMQTTLALALMLVGGQAWAINRCIGADGKAVFQDRPCAGQGEKLTVRPASGPAPKAAELEENAPAAAAAPMSTADRLNAEVAESQRQRRRQDLERSVPSLWDAIERHRLQCARRQQALREDKARANNNLAGAVWEQSISAEMSAAATMCDTRSRELRDELEMARTECRQLGGCR